MAEVGQEMWEDRAEVSLTEGFIELCVSSLVF